MITAPAFQTHPTWRRRVPEHVARYPSRWRPWIRRVSRDARRLGFNVQFTAAHPFMSGERCFRGGREDRFFRDEALALNQQGSAINGPCVRTHRP